MEIGFKTGELKKLYTEAGLEIVRYEEFMGVADSSRETHRLVRRVARKP